MAARRSRSGDGEPHSRYTDPRTHLRCDHPQTLQDEGARTPAKDAGDQPSRTPRGRTGWRAGPPSRAAATLNPMLWTGESTGCAALPGTRRGAGGAGGYGPLPTGPKVGSRRERRHLREGWGALRHHHRQPSPAIRRSRQPPAQAPRAGRYGSRAAWVSRRKVANVAAVPTAKRACRGWTPLA